MRSLSKLRAIQAFEAAARHQSYGGAAEELHVTPAAIGQQVRALEAWLGLPLFRRIESGSRRLVIVPDAEGALADFRQGLDCLERGLRRLRESRTNSAITVSASQAFVARWLMPRLESFTTAHPHLDVRIDVADRLVDLAHGEADLAIRCGSGKWPGVDAALLMREEVFPVCSPAFFKAQPLMRPADLLHQLLIDDAAAKAYSAFPDWQQWLVHAGVTGALHRPALQINASGAVLQAAVNGQGVALARSMLAFDDLRSNRLVRLFSHIEFPVVWAYYMVSAKEGANAEVVSLFRNWLQEEAAKVKGI
jgi:LysR family transcriptional regulator, glycine cleavage system transcriptional activator